MQRRNKGFFPMGKRYEKLEAYVLHNSFSRGIWLVIDKGNTFAIKEELKAIGCKFLHYRESAYVDKMAKAWALFIAEHRQEENLQEKAQAAMEKLRGLGIEVRYTHGILSQKMGLLPETPPSAGLA